MSSQLTKSGKRRMRRDYTDQEKDRALVAWVLSSGHRERAGLEWMKWHSWRHFTATRLLEMGVSHFDVSIQLGHTDGGLLVMSTYGHPSHDAARQRLLDAFKFDAEKETVR